MFKESLIESINRSPFNSAKSLKPELKMQKKFRDLYISKLKKIQLKYPENPIIVVENYDFICMGCPADYILFFNNEILITLYLNSNTAKYEEKKENKNIDDVIYDGEIYSDLLEIYENLNSEKKWNSAPEKYGTEDCFDGGHTFYTVYYPNRELESMYMRCWLPKEIRKDFK